MSSLSASNSPRSARDREIRRRWKEAHNIPIMSEAEAERLRAELLERFQRRDEERMPPESSL